MASSRRDKTRIGLSLLATALGLGSATAACTPATQDTPLPTGSGSGGSGASTASSGSGSGGTGGSNEGTGSSSGSSGSGGGVSGSGAAVGPGSGESSGSSSGSGDTSSGSSSGGAVDSGTSGGGSSSGTAGGGSNGGSNIFGGSGSSGGKDASVATGGDGGAGGGCMWITNADGTTNFDPAAPNKVVLFDGTSLSNWHKENMVGTPIGWTLNNDGTMTVVPSGTGQATLVQSNQKFDNLCVHVEYMTPMYPSSVTGQLRGNSGVYLKSAYEMQILDSYGQPPDINTCGAVYSIMKPLVVACHMQLVWNTYEIEFKTSVWNTATPPVKTGNAEFIKCALNGQVVQLNVPLNPPAGYTQAGIPDAPGPQPLGLQDHLDLVSFRNVWVRVPQY